MRSAILVFLAFGLILVAASPTPAAILFNREAMLQFTNVSLNSDVSDVNEMNFSGRVADNGSDDDLDGKLSVGDSGISVGGISISNYFNAAGDTVAQPSDTVAQIHYDLTGLIDWTSLVSNVDDRGTALDPTDDLVTFEFGDGGTLDLYVNTASVPNYKKGDADTWDDGTWVATFELRDLLTSPEFENNTTIDLVDGSGDTTVTMRLISQLGDSTAGDNSDDFFAVVGIDDLTADDEFLVTLVDTNNSVFPSGLSLGVSNLLGIGANFNPPTAGLTPTQVAIEAGLGGNDFPFDLITNVDGSAQLGVIPEPASFVIWLLLCGAPVGAIAIRRIRKR